MTSATKGLDLPSRSATYDGLHLGRTPSCKQSRVRQDVINGLQMPSDLAYRCTCRLWGQSVLGKMREGARELRVVVISIMSDGGGGPRRMNGLVTECIATSLCDRCTR